MSRVIMLTGGVRSGKSSYGESIFNTDDVIYIATNQFIDGEMEKRIEKHRETRNSKWGLLESYKGLSKSIIDSKESNVFLDCITAMITNFIFEDEENVDYEEVEENVIDELTLLINTCRESNKNLILITNEVGLGLVPEHKLGRAFRDISGNVNKEIAKLSDEVILMVSGIPVKVKEI